MPGPVSDSFDPEWGTSEARVEIDEALGEMYDKLSAHLGQKPPLYILDLVRGKKGKKSTLSLSEREWRLLRFALERARESL